MINEEKAGARVSESYLSTRTGDGRAMCQGVRMALDKTSNYDYGKIHLRWWCLAF